MYKGYLTKKKRKQNWKGEFVQPSKLNAVGDKVAVCKYAGCGR